MTIDELCENLHEELNASITSVVLSENTFQIVLQFDWWADPEQRNAVRIDATDVVEANLTPGPVYLVNVEADHPLLWQHNSSMGELYYSSTPMNTFEVVGRLCHAHFELFQGWRPETYVHATSEFLKRGNGLLARGPIEVMRAYQQAVRSEMEMKTNIIATYTPNGGFKLLLLDDKFAVCRSVRVEEVPVG